MSRSPTEQDALWLGIAQFVCSIAVLTPVWSPELLPLLDWPQHEAMVRALADVTTEPFRPYYAFEPQLSTYLGFYGVGALLAKGIGVEAALRVLVSLAFVGTPLALERLLKVLKRSPWASLLAFPIVFSWPFYMGFGAYVLAVPLALWTIAACVRHAESDAPQIGRIEVVVSSTLLFLTHALAFGAALLVAGLALAIFHHWVRYKRLARVALALVPSLLCFGWWFGTNFGAQHEDRLGAATASVHAQGGGGTEFESFERKVADLPMWFNEAFRDESDRQILDGWLVALGLVFFVGFLSAMWRRKKGVRDIPWQTWVVGLLLMMLYWVMPMSAANIWAISPRMILFGACGLALLVPNPPGRYWQNALTYAPVVALTCWVGWVNHQKFGSMDEDARNLEATLAEAEPGQRLYGLMYHPASAELSQAVMLHWGSYYMAQRGGLTGFTFINSPTVPLRLRTVGSSPYPGRRGEWEHARFRYDLYGDFYDYFLTHGSTNLGPRIGAPRGAIEQVTNHGRFSLWRNTQPRRTVAYSFRENVHHAVAYVGTGEGRTACAPWADGRLQCPNEEWTWVGPSEQTFDGIVVPCTWAHPVAGEPLEIVYDAVPPGDVIVGFAGVADSGQAARAADVDLAVRIGELRVPVISVGSNRGYRRFEMPMPQSDQAQRVTFRITAESDAARHYCFGATLFHEASD